MHDANDMDILASAVNAAKSGDRETAYALLRQLIEADDSNVTAWLWLAGVTDEPREAQVALKRVQVLDPGNPKLEQARGWLERRRETAIEDRGVGETPSDSEKTPESVLDAQPPELTADEAVTEPVQPAAESESAVEPAVEDREQAEPQSELRDEPPAPPVVADEESAMIETPVVPAEVGLAPVDQEWPPAGRPVRRQGVRWKVVGLAAALLGLLLLALIGLAQCASVAGAELGPGPTATPSNEERVAALRPNLEAARSQGHWQDALSVLRVMGALTPEDETLIRETADAYYQYALQLRDEGHPEQALEPLEQVLFLFPDENRALQEQQNLQQLIKGKAEAAAGNWSSAVATLTDLYERDSQYAGVTTLLYDAYCGLGQSQQQSGRLVAAKESFAAALAIHPDGQLAQEKARQVALLLTPPTPTRTPTPTASPTITPTPQPSATPTPDPARQRIEVDISEQRMYVYQDDQLIWDWVCSTGEPGKDTAPGTYAVRSKIGTAYASTWDLDMPFWMGIYESGPLENGIHALPIQRSTGSKLWEGYLGQPVSYGCIILSDENARTLYNWAQIGAPVIVRW